MTERKWQDDLHLTDDEILGLVHNEASDEVRQWFEIHRQNCPECAEAFEMVLAIEAREAEAPLTKLEPHEERSVLDRITKAIAKEPKLIDKIMAVLDWVKEGWEVAPMPAFSSAMRGPDSQPEDEEEEVDPLSVSPPEGGTQALRIALGEERAGATVRLTGGSEDVEVVLNAQGEGTLVLPEGNVTQLKLWLVEA